MGRKLQTFSRYRPRFLTLLVLLLTATLLVLSNLTYVLTNVSSQGGWHQNYGWPVVWYRLILVPWLGGGFQIHRVRLAVDAAVWLLILGVAGGVCEWLARRFRPRLRWNLRTMLAFTALAAACCGWFVVASRRARQRDEIVARSNRGESDINPLWIERRGPRWLGLFGVERYFQQLVGAKFTCWACDDQENEGDLNRLKDVLSLRLLYLEAVRLSPAMVDALEGMSQLKILSINADDPEWRPCLAAVGRMSRLEQLCLVNPNSHALAELAALHRLRGLHLQFGSPEGGDDPYSNPPLVASLPIFPQLETLTFYGPYLVDDDIRRLAAQSGLKALRIEAPIIGADLEALRALDALEELTIAGPLQAADILALRGLKSLKTLHIRDTYEPQAPSDLDRGALSALRRERPGLVIDGYTEALGWDEDDAFPPEYSQSEPQSLHGTWLDPLFWKLGDQLFRDNPPPW